MDTPRFLTVEEVIEIQEEQIRLFGGQSGIRDRALVESAVAAPSMGMGGQYYHADLFEMAASLLFSLAKNHPFIDGNKRVGMASALVFLMLNGIDIHEDEPAASNLVVGIASGSRTRREAVEYFREHTESPPAE